MTQRSRSGPDRRNRRRLASWFGAALLLLLPLIAMQFTDEVAWDLADFAIFGSLLFGALIAFELAARTTGDPAYRLAVGVALTAAVMLVWVNGAVGIIGPEDNVANLLYAGVLAVATVGSAIARLRPRGMARAMLATALAQALVGVIALVADWGAEGSGPLGAAALNGFFIALFVGSAWLFRRAAGS